MTTPFLKSAGGKRWLAPAIAPAVAAHLRETGGRYVEPFVGGGAVALAVDDLLLGAPIVIADVNVDLIAVWRGVQQDAASVADALDVLAARGVDQVAYLRVRESRPLAIDAAERAAWGVYLNHVGFNGLWRVNAAGKFNVPWGGPGRRCPSRESILAAGRLIQPWSIALADFRDTFGTLRAGDCGYMDPPYEGTFSAYTAGGFSAGDHDALGLLARAADRRGVGVLVSSRDSEAARLRYAGLAVLTLDKLHLIGARSPRRRDGQEALFGSPALIEAVAAIRPDGQRRKDFASAREALRVFWEANMEIMESADFSSPDADLSRDRFDAVREKYGRDVRTFRSAFGLCLGRARRWADADLETLRALPGLEGARFPA